MQRLADIRRLFIVKMSSIGDVVHALPFATIAKQNDPSLFIGWVVRKRCADLLTGHPNIDRLYVLPDKPGLSDLLKLARELRRDHYDAAMDMQGLLLSGVVTWLSGARRRIGLDLNRESNTIFLTEPIVPAKDRDRHAIDILRGFLDPLRIDHETEWPSAGFLAEGQSIPAELPPTIQARPLVALNVGASTVYKQWPQESWVALASQLAYDGFRPVLIGGPGDIETADNIARSVGGTEALINLAGQTTLRESAGVLKRCDLLVSADTGPMHLAVAVGTPVVALFGPTNPIRTGPYGTRNRVIWKQIACSPCYRHPTCEGRVDCMKLISVEDVMEAAKSMLAEGATC